MKFLTATALLLAATSAAPALADNHSEAPASALTVNTPIETLMANEKAAAVIDSHLPGIVDHPMYDSFKSMSLTQLAPYSQGMVTDETLAKISADLAKIG